MLLDAQRKYNHLLHVLPDPERESLLARSKEMPLELGKVLHPPGEQQAHAWFPIDGVVSLLYELTNGDSAEVAIIGHEGMVGLPVLMGNGSSPHRAVVQVAGTAWRMDCTDLRDLFEHNHAIRQILLRYSQAVAVQIGQTAVCNRHHRVEQQFCRWLLMSIDRLPGETLTMTHELIANMLGVRRASVTEIASSFREEGLIDYQRGTIRVLDRKTLEARCCECYSVVEDEYARLLPTEVIKDLG